MVRDFTPLFPVISKASCWWDVRVWRCLDAGDQEPGFRSKPWRFGGMCEGFLPYSRARGRSLPGRLLGVSRETGGFR